MLSILPVLGSWSSSVFNQLDCGSFIDAEWFLSVFLFGRRRAITRSVIQLIYFIINEEQYCAIKIQRKII